MEGLLIRRSLVRAQVEEPKILNRNKHLVETLGAFFACVSSALGLANKCAPLEIHYSNGQAKVTIKTPEKGNLR